MSNQQLERQKQDLFSNASHELKTPITSILGFAEMINNGIITDEGEKAVIMQRIEKEAIRMRDLINDILTISNLETAKRIPQQQEFFFDEVVREAAMSVSPLKDGTCISINVSTVPVWVKANKRQLRELIVNLIENAVKYNKPDGKIDIDLTSDGTDTTFCIKDTGIGISEKDQSHVFERFYRVDIGRDKRVGGTGLGLSIVKHIVNLLGGKIELNSTPDVGTEIKIILPIVKKCLS